MQLLVLISLALHVVDCRVLVAPYNPTEVLCALGKDEKGKPKMSKWCTDWVQCIDEKAGSGGTKEDVMAAWDPASCKEICGEWPSLTPPEGGKKKGKDDEKDGKDEKDEKDKDKDEKDKDKDEKDKDKDEKDEKDEKDKDKDEKDKKEEKDEKEKETTGLLKDLQDLRGFSFLQNDCVDSCGRFQESLSSCVAHILFEPGKVAMMGAPKPEGNETLPEICLQTGSPCMPSLAIQRQKCLSHRTRKFLDAKYEISTNMAEDCEVIEQNMELCKDCPQLQANYQTAYAAFTGGCLDQLHAYWQATHPKAAKEAIVAGAKGCKVH